MRAIIPALIPLCLASLVSSSSWIVTRHDKPDSLFIHLGTQYPALVHINLPTPKGAGDGEGTLIAPQWVLTAAHVGIEVKAGKEITVGGTPFTVDFIAIHKEWNDGPHDLALLRLVSPVAHISPAKLYRDTSELNQTIVIVGYGDFGTGRTGPVGNDRVTRGATNTVDEATDYWIKFRFDAPHDPRATPLEGVSGPGDSGGPAFLGEGENARLVGVSSGQSSRATGGLRGRYGVTEFYVRVSKYIAWIENITGPLPQ